MMIEKYMTILNKTVNVLNSESIMDGECAIISVILILVFFSYDSLVNGDVITQLPYIKETLIELPSDPSIINDIYNTYYECANSTLDKNSLGPFVDKIRLIVLHEKKQWILLTTLNPDSSINVHDFACIDQHTTEASKTVIEERFNTALSTIVNSRVNVPPIDVIIINKPVLGIFVPCPAFLPLSDVLLTHHWNLHAYIVGVPEINYHLLHVNNNQHLLEQYIDDIMSKIRLIDSFRNPNNPNWNTEYITLVYRATHNIWYCLLKFYEMYNPFI